MEENKQNIELETFVDDIYTIFDRWTDLGAEDEDVIKLKNSVKGKVLEIIKWSKQK